MKNERTMYIRNNESGNDIITVHNDDNVDTLMNAFNRYTERYTEVTFVIDLNDMISSKSIQRLIKVLRTIKAYNNVVLDITLRCDKLLREYDFYNDIKSLL